MLNAVVNGLNSDASQFSSESIQNYTNLNHTRKFLRCVVFACRVSRKPSLTFFWLYLFCLCSANILLDMEYNAKVSDFGLARAVGRDGHGGKTTKVMGTSGYIAPEYLHGEISDKIDVYAFGVVSYRACDRSFTCSASPL